jgi:prepilin-type N-terminal cleavage/methylation domain-containing protein
MYFILKKEKGFTIIELIISIFILSIAIVGTFSAFLIMTILTSETADRLTATYLAQDGIEIVRNIRDNNWLKMKAGVSGTNWTTGLYNANGIDCSCSISDCRTKGCEADYTTGTGVSGAWPMSPWAGGHYLNINTNGFYYYNILNPSQTKFERRIIITPITDIDGVSDPDMSNATHVHIVKVIVQVTWKIKANILYTTSDAGVCGFHNCITTEVTLYDWYNYIH